MASGSPASLRWGRGERARATPNEDGVSPRPTKMPSGPPASLRWGRGEFGWSQRPGQDTQVVGCYVFWFDRWFVHGTDFATAPGRTLPRWSPWAPFCRDFSPLGDEGGGDEREPDLGSRPDTGLEDELVRRVRAPAEGPETVHR